MKLPWIQLPVLGLPLMSSWGTDTPDVEAADDQAPEQRVRRIDDEAGRGGIGYPVDLAAVDDHPRVGVVALLGVDAFGMERDRLGIGDRDTARPWLSGPGRRDLFHPSDRSRRRSGREWPGSRRAFRNVMVKDGQEPVRQKPRSSPHPGSGSAHSVPWPRWHSR